MQAIAVGLIVLFVAMSVYGLTRKGEYFDNDDALGPF